jgi:hypothetical protein
VRDKAGNRLMRALNQRSIIPVYRGFFLCSPSDVFKLSDNRVLYKEKRVAVSPQICNEDCAMKWLDKIPLAPLVIFGIALALAPFSPQPHLLEKIQMLVNGQLSRPIDIFDLFWHSVGLVLIVLKLIRMRQLKTPTA